MDKETNLMEFEKGNEPGEIELPQLDVRKFANIKTTIDKVEYRKGGVFKGKQSYYCLFISKIVGKENDIEIKASKLIGLQTSNEGKIGWGKDTLMDKFLKKYKISNPKDMVGKSVLTIIVENEKTGKEYLSFI